MDFLQKAEALELLSDKTPFKKKKYTNKPKKKYKINKRKTKLYNSFLPPSGVGLVRMEEMSTSDLIRVLSGVSNECAELVDRLVFLLTVGKE